LHGHSAKSANPDARRLVLGAAVDFRPARVRIFIESLRRSGYRGDVLMLVGWAQFRLAAYLRRFGVETAPMWSAQRLHGPIHAYRFEKFARILHSCASRYDEVLVSDVRDVAFQRHPFSTLSSGPCRFYLEGAGWTIGSEPTNARWARTFLTPDQVGAIAADRISCCGVVIGGTAAMTTYLDRLAAHLHALPLRLRRLGGADTAFHNLMAHLTHEVECEIVENNLDVATMGLEPPSAYEVGPDHVIRTADGHVPMILHQYDRIPAIRHAVEARFAPTRVVDRASLPAGGRVL
jgi:hypothetical protein